MLVHLYIAMSVKPYTALHVNLCMQVNIKRVLGVHLLIALPTLCMLTWHWFSQGEEMFAEDAGQQR